MILDVKQTRSVMEEDEEVVLTVAKIAAAVSSMGAELSRCQELCLSKDFKVARTPHSS